jgi:hypothetical protein
VTGGHDTRVSLVALIATRPGCRPRLIYRTRRGRGSLLQPPCLRVLAW